jgi:uncharacterized protein (DUF58 family)
MASIFPTPRLAALALVVAAIAVVAGYLPAVRGPLFGLDAALAAAALIDVALARGRRVLVEREAAAIFSVGRRNQVTLTLRNTSGRALRGTVADDPLEGCSEIGDPAPFVLEGHGTAAIKYEVIPSRRGRRELRGVTVRYASLLGLVARQERTALSAFVDVYPDVHAARSLELLRRQGRQDARLGSLRVRGGDTEFERLRPYQRGDEIRHIDWRATARRDDLTARQFQAESNQNVVFVLDVGRGMRGEAPGVDSEGGGASQALSAVDRALNAALLTADVVTRAGDKAGLLVFDDAPRAFVPPAGGTIGVRRLTRAIHALQASLNATDYAAAMAFLRAQVRSRSLFIVFTQLLEPRAAKELASSLKGLLPRHLPLCVLMRDMDIEALVTAPVAGAGDLYVRAAAAEALASRDALVRSLVASGVLVLDVSPADLTPALVRRYLDVKSRRLL